MARVVPDVPTVAVACPGCGQQLPAEVLVRSATVHSTSVAVVFASVHVSHTCKRAPK